MASELKEVIIYADGACVGNPGPGGYGIVLIYGDHRKELSRGFRKTTNNRMELFAAIVALETLKERCSVSLYSDSQYLVNAIKKGWARKWRSMGWMRNKDEKAANPDLWQRLLRLCEYHEVDFKWIRGHAGNKENERCDELAVAASLQPNLPADLEYEKSYRS
jgi:ribonuclease HI